MTSASYPYIVAWPEIAQAVGEARIAEAAARANDPPSPPSVQSKNAAAPTSGSLLPSLPAVSSARGPRPRLQGSSPPASSFREDAQPGPSSSRAPPQAGPQPGDPAFPASLPRVTQILATPPASGEELLNMADWPGPSVPTCDTQTRGESTGVTGIAPARQPVPAESQAPAAAPTSGSTDPALEAPSMQATDTGQAGQALGAAPPGGPAEPRPQGGSPAPGPLGVAQEALLMQAGDPRQAGNLLGATLRGTAADDEVRALE